MTRLPYGTFKTLTPEQQIQHRRESARKYRQAHREQINARNNEIFDRWRKEKPFRVICKTCGKSFNAARKTIRKCPKCHEITYHLICEKAEQRRIAYIARTEAKQKMIAGITKLHKRGLYQAKIAQELGISQRLVGYYLLKMGMRTIKKHHRKQNI